jgi:hypothetical protein
MRLARRLLLLNFALGFYNVGTVWLTQVACYPLWANVGRAEWPVYHVVWWRSIQGVTLGPATLALLGSLAMLRWRPPHVPAAAVWLGAALPVAVLIGTAAWFAPLMARLTEVVDPTGISTPRFRLLLTTHWLRVALVTAHAGLIFWFVTVGFAPETPAEMPRPSI